MGLMQKIGESIAGYLAKERLGGRHLSTCDPLLLEETLKPGDVLLVEGSSRFSSAIKYITQSTWSHSAIYVGDCGLEAEGEEKAVLIEADVVEGVRAVPISQYTSYHTRICRPVGITPDELSDLKQFLIDRLGYQYDLKNIFDLARYFLHPPPIPSKWRRQLLALGSGDPTRAICSSLIALAFQSVKYPILPERLNAGEDGESDEENRELYHIRHHSLFAPRDFDVSPYFEIVKPTIYQDFDPHQLLWATDAELRKLELRF
ncbi:YiiX/YebB-like N1pC/P60 family cysteine hydrolase [Lentisphaera profundi]|uniref:YiiX/YebB-like N1pC/P60 family cysteine hydrolase n=1 Tax=Lentisphaera profundi TaxID=1658616 RepID=A0ABY7VXA6_9BACT|nr:YiiX/YebB-like N1pC/P60 family cysteine hydrolase [Lentisphaera profundi]WDE98732.1 YiiX/YebB-like N1pC/P60 family cysteine hydrolase [Lentisphaera profundi]